MKSEKSCKDFGEKKIGVLMSVKEVSEYLGVSKQVLYSWVFNKKCPLPVIRVGGSMRFNREMVERFGRGEVLD